MEITELELDWEVAHSRYPSNNLFMKTKRISPRSWFADFVKIRKYTTVEPAKIIGPRTVHGTRKRTTYQATAEMK